ncbi:MAG: LLM class flavin-dependent oxidoreductase [Candidatus Tectomicrobia bacterium]|uniref:LLM class flavin-dependent oxidoreductase n=1 Tax=Tectimicrobiota bacterium TaxID=2528274 RepID=A0A932M0Z5_UNCTE|nr:LLM class flavin-dependent oxidoreductase [Candidatus Tectomicrobia bacterium]
MAKQRIGVTAMGGDSKAVVARIQELERMGVSAAWLTTGGAGLDGLTLFAAAAARTERILLGTCITPTWPRHPIVTASQAQVVAQLSPGRFRLGVGPSHKAGMETMFGAHFRTALANLREYLTIVKTLLREGSVDFDGEHYHAHAKIEAPVRDVPVMASALRRRSFELCGEHADGAISWVCPGHYLREVALPAMKEGARKAERDTPPLVAHVPVCVHDNLREVRAVAREQMVYYPKLPFYQQMFVDAGYPEAKEGAWSDRLLDAVVAMGKEEQVAGKLRELLAWGATEIIAMPITAGPQRDASMRRTLSCLAEVSKTL